MIPMHGVATKTIWDMDSPEGRTRNTFGTENLSKEDDLVKQEESHIIIDPGTKHKKFPALLNIWSPYAKPASVESAQVMKN